MYSLIGPHYLPLNHEKSKRSPEIQDGQIPIFCIMYIERYRKLTILYSILRSLKVLPLLGDDSLLHCLDDILIPPFV